MFFYGSNPPEMYFVLGRDNTYAIQIMREDGGPVNINEISSVSAKIVKIGDASASYNGIVTLSVNDLGAVVAHVLFPKEASYPLLSGGNVLYLQWEVTLVDGIKYVIPVPPQQLVVVTPV